MIIEIPDGTIQRCKQKQLNRILAGTVGSTVRIEDGQEPKREAVHHLHARFVFAAY